MWKHLRLTCRITKTDALTQTGISSEEFAICVSKKIQPARVLQGFLNLFRFSS